MAHIQITTTQNVSISFKAAEVGERISAWCLDILIKLAYIGVVSFLLFGITDIGTYLFNDLANNDQWSMMALMILIGAPLIFYTIVFEALVGGQTIGKKILKIQVVKIDGYQAGFSDFFIRWVMRIVDINMISGVVALVSMGSSKYHQRIGGMASGTAVISRKNKINIDHTILQELDVDYSPTYFSVVKLSDNDMRIIKENYEKSKEASNHKTILKIKEKVIKVIEQEPLSEHNDSLFLETVIKDYNYFTKNM